MGKILKDSKIQDIVVSSMYAPLNRKGPLPPGVTVRVVRDAYKTIPIRARMVLSFAKIPNRLSSPNVALREALDLPDVREDLAKLTYKDKSLAFHQLLYDATRFSRVGKGLHKRLISPSIDVNESGLLFLNPTRFNVLLATEMRGFDSNINHLEQGSTEEALAFFTLSFGLLQPEDADDIVQAVLEYGYGFMIFFGVADETCLTEYDADKSLGAGEDHSLIIHSHAESPITDKMKSQVTYPESIPTAIEHDSEPETKSLIQTDKTITCKEV